MTRWRAGLAVGALWLGQSSVVEAAASAETKECIAAFDQGQRLKNDHHLKDAQTRLLVCTRDACPAVLRADCAEVLKSTQAATPSIVFAAEDLGKDVTDVKVFNGSDLVASAVDGRSIDVDPGTYDFRFEHGTLPPATVHFVVREGEKNREVRAVFRAPPPPPPVAAVVPVAPPVREKRSAAGYLVPAGFAALGIAGFVVAGVTRKTFDTDVLAFEAQCAPNCTEASRAELSNTLVRANVALGVGIGGLALAAITWLLSIPGSKPPPPTAAALTW